MGSLKNKNFLFLKHSAINNIANVTVIISEINVPMIRAAGYKPIKYKGSKFLFIIFNIFFLMSS